MSIQNLQNMCLNINKNPTLRLVLVILRYINAMWVSTAATLLWSLFKTYHRLENLQLLATAQFSNYTAVAGKLKTCYFFSHSVSFYQHLGMCDMCNLFINNIDYVWYTMCSSGSAPARRFLKQYKKATSALTVRWQRVDHLFVLTFKLKWQFNCF